MSDGIKELQKLFKEVEKAPKRVLTKSAKSGAQIILEAAKENVNKFKDTGALAASMGMKKEKSKKARTKTVYQVRPNNKNQEEPFVKISKDGKKRAYYPASMEYGWTDADGKYHPGYRYMRRAAEEKGNQANNEIIKIMGSELDKILR